MKKQQDGFVMVVSLIFLTIITLLCVFMFGGFIKDQQMAGNYREKARAVDSAQAALNSTEIWLGGAGNTYFGGGAGWVAGTNCSTVVGNVPVVCSNALATPKTLPWPSYTTFLPAGMNVGTNQANSYSGQPNVYVQYLGQTAVNPPTALYQVTTNATGGNSSAVTVVQAVYQVQATSRDLGL